MKKYTKPEIRVLPMPDGWCGEDLLKLSDEELARVLAEARARQEKRYQIKQEFILREIAGEHAIVPTGDDSAFSNAMMTPNRTAAFLWKAFEESSTIEDVVEKGLFAFDVPEERLRDSVGRFVRESLQYRVLKEEE